MGDTLHYLWWFYIVTYAFLCPMLCIMLGLVHPVIGVLPVAPPLILAIREANRRDKVILAEGWETGFKRMNEVVDQYVRLVNKKGGD